MADILCLKGDAAFSAFRLQRLANRLTAAVADIEWVSADGRQRGRIVTNGHSPAWRP